MKGSLSLSLPLSLSFSRSDSKSGGIDQKKEKKGGREGVARKTWRICQAFDTHQVDTFLPGVTNKEKKGKENKLKKRGPINAHDAERVAQNMVQSKKRNERRSIHHPHLNNLHSDTYLCLITVPTNMLFGRDATAAKRGWRSGTGRRRRGGEGIDLYYNRIPMDRERGGRKRRGGGGKPNQNACG